MYAIKTFFQKELVHFQRLHRRAQRLIISIFLYNFISPLFSVFTSAFLWRQSQDFIQIALYSFAMYVTVPFGFYLNGYLLRHYPANKLYVVGLLMQAITISTLIFLATTTLLQVIPFGLVMGIAIGIYWANRNLLTLRTTRSDNRIYFSGLEISSNTITGIVIPFLIGLFITAGTPLAMYTPLVAYKILALLMIIVSAIIGTHILPMKDTKEIISTLWVTKASKRWQQFRWYEVIIGFLTGAITFLPPLMVFIFVGNENALGTIQSISALITAVIIYSFAKKLTTQHRLTLITWGMGINMLGTLVFSLFFSPIGVFVFYASLSIMWPLLWIAINSLNYDLIDEDNKSHLHYAYVCDQEIYLNIGRLIAIGLFILIIVFVSKNAALRYTPLIYATGQIFLFFSAKSLERKNDTTGSANLFTSGEK